MEFTHCYRSDKIMKLLTCIVWLFGGIFWIIDATREMNNVWYWIFGIFSFVICITHTIVFVRSMMK